MKLETRVQGFMLLCSMYAYKHLTTSCMIQEDLCMSTSVDTGSSYNVRKESDVCMHTCHIIV